MHESLDEFKFRPDTPTDSRVICPYASEKLTYNVVNTLAPLFLIGSFSYLQVTRMFNISKTNRPIKTKFCKHIIIDKIYVGIVNHCF